jgi:hypothetical protein
MPRRRNAHQAALAERTRERVPLDWAMMQNNLGTALAKLGKQDSSENGTARLEEAVAAYRSSVTGVDPRSRAAQLGDDAEQPWHRASDARGTGGRDGAAGRDVRGTESLQTRRWRSQS